MSDSIRLINNESVLKSRRDKKRSMKKNIGLLLILIFLSGCFGSSIAYLGPASTSAASGNLARSAFTSSVSFGIKKQTGKLPIEHAIAYAEDKNPHKKNKKKEPCLSFIEKTNSEICAMVKKRLNSTKSKLLKTTMDKPIKDHTSSLHPKIDKKYKIKYLD